LARAPSARRTSAISIPDGTRTDGTSPDPFGPSLAYVTGSLLDTGVQPDRLVATHCCFCGQQCGMCLKVKDERVVGVEPRIDFPFNQGKLCPKGISRYLQNNHPDRLLRAYCRDADAPGGFRAIEYDEAITRVASEIERIQRTHGADAMAVLSGASLTTEKTYLMGKFARVCLKTRHIDYNGRLCMVSAAAGNKKAFGVDRAGVHSRTCSATASNPCVWSRMNSWSSQSCSIIRWSTPLKSATSRPGRIGRKRSHVRAIGVMRGSTTMMRAPCSRLPDVVGGDRRAFGDVGAADPHHLGADHVGHGIRRAPRTPSRGCRWRPRP
jgi:hypothetical protein